MKTLSFVRVASGIRSITGEGLKRSGWMYEASLSFDLASVTETISTGFSSSPDDSETSGSTDSLAALSVDSLTLGVIVTSSPLSSSSSSELSYSVTLSSSYSSS
jgi:hypothetical protein